MSDGIQFDKGTAEFLEKMYRTPDVAGQRTRVLHWLDLRPGYAALDVGVGPGLLALDMARTVGANGRVAGIDLSEAMLTMTRERLADEPATMDFREADATSLPFDDGSFDAVVSTQVYEYVPDLNAALLEVERVLRPGGRVVILDTDWDSLVWNTNDRARMRRVMDAWDAHLHDAHVPSTLGAKLNAARLRTIGMEVLPLVNTAPHGNCYSAGIMFAISSFVAGRSDITQEEAQAWLEELLQLGTTGEYFFSLNRYIFTAVKRG